MFKYIVVQDKPWVNDETFEVALYPTVVEAKSLSGEVALQDHILVEDFPSSAVGRIYINGVYFASPEEIT